MFNLYAAERTIERRRVEEQEWLRGRQRAREANHPDWNRTVLTVVRGGDSDSESERERLGRAG